MIKFSIKTLLNLKALRSLAPTLSMTNRVKLLSTSRIMEIEKNPQISDVLKHDKFTSRHIGPSNEEIKEMLKVVKADSLEEFTTAAVPEIIRLPENAKREQEKILGGAISEHTALMNLKEIAGKNTLFTNYIGCGYNPVIVPPIILRMILENPMWYTSYTPYQAEISQGRLESLLNFQTLIAELTGLPISNASLLDEANSAADAMNMAYGILEGARSTFFIAENLFPFIKDTIKTMAHHRNINIIEGNPADESILNNPNIFGGIVQNPDNLGKVSEYSEFAKRLKQNGAIPIIATDISSLLLTKTPAEMGFDIAVGSAQRFGVPMSNGGPHAGFMSTKEEYKRKFPGRIVGISKDKFGNPGYRLSLQTREQHIRRDRATSNICTAEALLANMAAFYAIFHGKEGLIEISKRINLYARFLATHLSTAGFNIIHQPGEIFDTVAIDLKESGLTCQNVLSAFEKKKINIRCIRDDIVSLTMNERTTLADLEEIIQIFYSLKNIDTTFDILKHTDDIALAPKLNENLQRGSKDFLKQEIFNKYKSETQIMRYIHFLQLKDISLCNSMIPLGSCTMKLNATSELIPITWPEFTELHPFSPLDQMKGSKQMIDELSQMLATITQFHSTSFQAKSGAHGELTGLLTIRRYFESIGQKHRNICLIPASSHGTNFASAAFSGLKVVVVATDNHGNVKINDLREKAKLHKDKLCCLMVTYPSTHGVFEEKIKEMTEIVHNNGGQVYMDGANMNAQVLLTSPGTIDADCCHLNLHKTMAMPHGGGGGGSGPICVKKHLTEFLPGHVHINKSPDKNWSTSSAPHGNAGLLPITYMYIKMLGKDIKKSTQIAILNANYMMEKLNGPYKILYRGKNNKVAHEFIIDVRDIKKKTGVSEEDIAKRLMDYGFHAPTISFPVPGTLMIEPTESEDKEELDRFCDAMIEIRNEIREIEEGKADKKDNVLKNAPHSQDHCISTAWKHPYSREKAAFPLPYIKKRGKFWPSVGRIDNVYGDMNLKCCL